MANNRPPRPPIKKVKRKKIILKPRLGSRKSIGAEPSAIPATPITPPYSILKIAGTIFILILIILIIYLLLPKTTDCGYDKECFIEKANNCETTILRTTIGDGTIIKHTAKDCILKKTIEKFSETEPEEVTSFFRNKEMICYYIEGEFNTFWIEGLSTGMDDCEGELKDAIIELRLAQLTLE